MTKKLQKINFNQCQIEFLIWNQLFINFIICNYLQFNSIDFCSVFSIFFDEFFDFEFYFFYSFMRLHHLLCWVVNFSLELLDPTDFVLDDFILIIGNGEGCFDILYHVLTGYQFLVKDSLGFLQMRLFKLQRTYECFHNLFYRLLHSYLYLTDY